MKGDGVGSSSAGGGAWGLAQLARQLCHASQGLAILCRNRTIVGLKVFSPLHFRLSIHSRNRTIVGLKGRILL